MTMRALVSSDRPVVRIWHPDNPEVVCRDSVREPRSRQHRGRAVEWDVEVRDRAGVRRGRPVLTQAELGISWREAAARRIGGDELKWWPALLQCLLGLQCQSRPSAAYVQKNGLQSRIWRVCHHPLTVSGPKPAFKWSKHRRPPKRRGAERPGRPPFGSGEEAHSARYSAPHTRLLPELNIPSVRYLTQHNSILICVVQMTHSSVLVLLPRAGRHPQGLPT